MSSLFVKCMVCQQRPATIKCNQCQLGQTYRLCYSCDSQVHNKNNPSEEQHKTEIIPYQEMYQKAGSASALKDSSLKSKPEQQQQKQQPQGIAKPQSSASSKQFSNNFKSVKPEVPQKEDILNNQKLVKEPVQLVQQQSLPNKFTNNYIYPQSQNKQKVEPKQEEIQRQNNSASYMSNQNNKLKEQIQDEQDQNNELRREIQQTKDQIKNINSEIDKKIQQNQRDFEKKINDLKKESTDEKKKINNLTDEVKKLTEQVKSVDQQTQKKLDLQKKQYEKQIKDMEQVINEKQQQIDEIAEEFQNYNLEEIQAKMEEMANELDEKDQIIEELKNQLEQGGGLEGGEKREDNDELIQQLEQKDEEIKKLEELIENFKQLYQQMQDEKQAMMEENEKLQTENNQFRELFSQNLHLFGIDPNQLEEEEGEGEGEQEGEQYEQDEEEN
ncbi:unnamed protein product [Paramecium primaurelia]|uniref:Uncharacterized protein n=1 Tax=Paramecium primaurelia TaxID=5886 RepID=A0A8S1JM91_PARPR|nr:unnamed protein product [Paramecium primaurelia]